MSTNWVTIDKFAEISGYSEDAIRKKITNGVLLEGRVWKYAPDTRQLISLRGYDEWVESESVASKRGAKPRSRLNSAIAG